MKKILIINPFGIGDVLFTTPVLSAIKDACPDTIIGYWCNERVKDILKNNKNIDKIFALSRGDIKKIYNKSRLEGIFKGIALYKSIKKERFDVSLDFSLDHRYGFISKLAGIKKRIGFNYKNRGRFLTDKITIDGYAQKHVVEYYLELLDFIGIKPKTKNLDLYVSDIDRVNCKDILASYSINDKGLIIGIAPGGGASWGKDAAIKRWPAIKFAQLADKISKDFAAQILLLGDESDRPIIDIIVKTATYPVIDLAGKTSLAELIGIINNVEILIANDGGPLHIAVALGKKTVSFFGPVDPKVYGPYPADAKRHIVLRKELECSPCYSGFRLSGCLKNRECLEKIDIQEAVSAVASLLKTDD